MGLEDGEVYQKIRLQRPLGDVDFYFLYLDLFKGLCVEINELYHVLFRYSSMSDEAYPRDRLEPISRLTIVPSPMLMSLHPNSRNSRMMLRTMVDVVTTPKAGNFFVPPRRYSASTGPCHSFSVSQSRHTTRLPFSEHRKLHLILQSLLFPRIPSQRRCR